MRMPDLWDIEGRERWIAAHWSEADPEAMVWVLKRRGALTDGHLPWSLERSVWQAMAASYRHPDAPGCVISSVTKRLIRKLILFHFPECPERPLVETASQ